MTMSDAMISALLVTQLRRFRLLALARLRGVASRAPWGNRVKKSAWRSHRTLPVDGPEEIEARQCGIWVVIIDIAATRQVQLRIRKGSYIWHSGKDDLTLASLAPSAARGSKSPAAIVSEGPEIYSF